jgi:uroporphyrinogen decarboxylase
MNDRFLRACRREPVDRTPIWLMRQAGRYLPEYRKIREKASFEEMCKTPELSVEVTLQPIRRFGFDAAILFSDILVPLEPMGAPFRIEEKRGPIIENPVRTRADLDRLRRPEPEELSYVLEAIKILRRELPVPLIGFAGAPFTLASYLIEGGSSKGAEFRLTKSFLYQEPEAGERLLSLLAETVGRYLAAQVAAGAQAVQIFDSWAGQLTPDDFDTYALPYARRVVELVRPSGVPIIYFCKGGTSYLERCRAVGSDVVGLDFFTRLDRARDLLGGEVAVQGNLDPCALFMPRERLQQTARGIVRQNAGRPGHIFNLGHGVLPPTDPDQVAALLEAVREESTVNRQSTAPEG